MAGSEIQQLKDVLELLSYAVILLGIPVGLIQCYRTARKEQLDREYGTYNALDEKYLEFQNLCLEHPNLDIFDVPDTKVSILSSDQRKQELVALTILFALFERAYLMYSDQSTKIKERQWTGWEQYIESYCHRAKFRQAWELSGSTFDSHFQDYMKTRLAASNVR